MDRLIRLIRRHHTKIDELVSSTRIILTKNRRDLPGNATDGQYVQR